MRRAALAAALAALLLLTGAARCRRVPPKTWNGTIAVGKLGGVANVSAQFFQSNGCSWENGEALRDVDGLIWDVRRYAKLKVRAVWTTDGGTAPSSVGGYYLDAGCERLRDEGWAQPQMGKPAVFRIPKGARWMVVEAQTLSPSGEIRVTMRSPGRRCRRR